MPLRPEMRKYYGPEWRTYRAQLIEATGHQCAQCRARLPAAELSGAHLYHDPRAIGLVSILCFSCHAKHDAPHRLAMMRRSRARRTGQLWLLPELEWSAYPAWEVPPEVLAPPGELFPDA